MTNIEERIRKLLALAGNNTNAAEAAAAAAKAAELALEYGLELEKIAASKGEKLPIGYKPIHEPVSDPHDWMNYLGRSICEANGCRFIWFEMVEGWVGCAIGRDQAIDASRIMMAYLLESMKRTQRTYIASLGLSTPKARAEWRYAYRFGYVMTVGKRVEEWSDSLKNTKGALVLYQAGQLAEVDEFVKGMHIQEKDEKAKPVNAEAYKAGVRDGGQVSVNRQMEATKQAEQRRIA